MAKKPYTITYFHGTDDEVNEQWLEARKKGIGGSEVATICGVNKYSSPYELWLQKTGLEPAPDLSDKQSVEWGHRLEDVIAQKFKEEHPELEVTNSKGMYVSIERPWAFANVDRLLKDANGKRGVLEIKTTSVWRRDDWDKEAPLYYMPQLMHYLSVTGFDYGYFAVLIGGQEYREIYVERDEDDIEVINRCVDTFWNDNVVTHNPPIMIGGQGESDALLRQNKEFGSEFNETQDVSYDQIIDEILSITESMAELKSKKEQLENTLKNFIGDNKGMYSPKYKVTWNRGMTSRFNSSKFKQDYPDLVASYTTESLSNRGLRITERK